MNYNPYLEKVEKAKKGIFEPTSNLQITGGRYDPNAPKFKYQRNFLSKTRKTLRTTKEMEPDLIGSIAPVSEKKQKRSLYPSTKPMIGWERVFAGRGRVVKKGRRKQTSKRLGLIRPSKKGLKSSKPQFTKWATTYGGEFDFKTKD